MRVCAIAGNWKMHGTRESAVSLARGLRDGWSGADHVEVGVAPPFPHLTAVAAELEGSPVWVAGQDLYWEKQGAFTGEVSGPMLVDAGCSHVILGHSERRRVLGECPETVGRKVRAALEVGLAPILCLGETLEEREAERTAEVVFEQIEAALHGLAEGDLAALILAYEPVWAIGTGVHASPQQATEVHALLRGWLGERFSTSFAESVRIQYGGSVKPGNAAELLAADHVDGALVGGASLEAKSFLGIVQAAPSLT